ncbi:MAG: SAM-dependent chlorinase/fluorinase [Acidobacteriota bacterium]|nr:SAM-dependent chlorinase/fluorinase [Acidobacteriota bacterium]
MNGESSSNLIALLTDFGTQDYFVGAMKGVIFSINPAARIVDITHEIEPQNIAAAKFNLRACYRNFPVKTIFAAVVDPGVGSNRKAILVKTADYFFIAPDNGLLSFVFSENPDYKVYELTNESYFAENISRTFHGRDVFAPAAAHLSKGAATDSFGARIKDYVRLEESKPRRLSLTAVEAEIIHIDRFGNLITNLKRGDLPAIFTLEINGAAIKKRVEFFAEGDQDTLFMIFGSAGFLEIAAFRNSARDLLNARIGEKIIAANAL